MVRRQIGAVGTALLLAACQTPVLSPGSPARASRPIPIAKTPSVSPSSAPSANLGKVVLQGRIQAPASLIGNNGGNVVSNGGANLRLLAAVSEAPVANARVRLVDAAGQPVPDGQGRPLESTTDAAGRYGFTAALPAQNLVLEVVLPAEKGTVRALVPKDRAEGAAVDGGLVSTLATGYILARYVQGQADTRQTLDRLPAAIEAETRERTRQALEGGTTAVPEALTSERIVEVVDRLRGADPALDAQFEKVRELLIVAGQQDLGNGQMATEVPLGNVRGLVAHPDGTIDILCHTVGRLYRLGADGRLGAIAGNGGAATEASLKGAPATDAALGWLQFALRDRAGRTLISSKKRVVRLRTDGTLEEFWPYTEQSSLYFAVPTTGDGILVAAEDGVWEVGPNQERRLKRPLAEGEARILADVANLGQDAQGRVYVATKPLVNSARDKVYRYGADMAVLTPLTTAAEAGAVGLILDSAGNRFAYKATGAVELTRPDGTTASFTGPWTDEKILRGAQMTTTSDGTLLVCRQRQIFRVNEGVESRVAGSPESAVDSLNQMALSAPSGLVTMPNNELVVASYYDHRVYRLTPGQEPEPLAGNGTNTGVRNGPALEVELQGPISLKRHTNGDLYVITAHNRLVCVAADGAASVKHNVNYDKIWLLGAAVAPSGDVFVSGARHTGDTVTAGFVRRLPADGSPYQVLFEEAEGQDPTLHYMAVHPNGELYLLGPGKLSRWTAELGLLVVKEDARFTMRRPEKSPLDRMCFDRTGRLYFVDDKGIGVTRYDPNLGDFTAIAGPGSPYFTGHGADDSLIGAQSLAFNESGDLLICARQLNQIKRIPASALAE